jgi:hypothetical protein
MMQNRVAGRVYQSAQSSPRSPPPQIHHQRPPLRRSRGPPPATQPHLLLLPLPRSRHMLPTEPRPCNIIMLVHRVRAVRVGLGTREAVRVISFLFAVGGVDHCAGTFDGAAAGGEGAEGVAAREGKRGQTGDVISMGMRAIGKQRREGMGTHLTRW